MLFAHIGVIDENFEFRPDCFVGVRGDTIAYLGADEPAEDFGERYDGRGKVLLPGLVNAHSHAPMTLMRGYAENLALDDWLNTMIFPFEAKMTDDEVYPATMLAIAEMLRFGTTSFSDMYSAALSIRTLNGFLGTVPFTPAPSTMTYSRSDFLGADIACIILASTKMNIARNMQNKTLYAILTAVGIFILSLPSTLSFNILNRMAANPAINSHNHTHERENPPP